MGDKRKDSAILIVASIWQGRGVIFKIAGKDLTIYIDDNINLKKGTFIPDYTSRAGILGNVVYINNQKTYGIKANE